MLFEHTGPAQVYKPPRLRTRFEAEVPPPIVAGTTPSHTHSTTTAHAHTRETQCELKFRRFFVCQTRSALTTSPRARCARRGSTWCAARSANGFACPCW